MAEESPPPQISGPPQFAARAKTRPDRDDSWFTIGQAWTFSERGKDCFRVSLTFLPTNWDGEMLLMPIPETDEPEP
jgi:hypothetical protein